MTTNNDDLEPISPRKAYDLFLNHKATACAKATVRNHRYRLQYFVQWCEAEGIDNMNDLTGRDIQRFRMWRQDEKDLEPTTMRNHLCTLRVFLKWAASIEAVKKDLYDKIILPDVGHGERHREEMLDSESAKVLLEYLSRYHFASIEHVALALLWQSGMRIGSALAIDLDDVDFDDESIQVNHRPERGTPLKNGKSGERPIAITTDLSKLLKEYIENRHHQVEDEYGREPLLTTKRGRIHHNTLRRLVYRVTAPCFRDEDCPGCNADNKRKCPEAVNPHAIRRGSITHFLTEDVPVEIVGDRMNVSRDVLEEHYDQRSDEVKLEQRRGYLNNI